MLIDLFYILSSAMGVWGVMEQCAAGNRERRTLLNRVTVSDGPLTSGKVSKDPNESRTASIFCISM